MYLADPHSHGTRSSEEDEEEEEEEEEGEEERPHSSVVRHGQDVRAACVYATMRISFYRRGHAALGADPSRRGVGRRAPGGGQIETRRAHNTSGTA